MSLTPKQQKFLEFIESSSEKKGYAPSQAEIAKHFGYTSLGTVQNYLKALEAKGYLSRQKFLSRSLKPMSVAANTVSIPLVGRVAAGHPMEAIEQNDCIDVPPVMLRGGNNFALRVKGDSMIEEGIHDEDIVVVKKQEKADEGQIIIAMVDGEATVKKYYRRRNVIELRPANAALKPILVHPHQGFQILGIVVGLIRKYG